MKTITEQMKNKVDKIRLLADEVRKVDTLTKTYQFIAMACIKELGYYTLNENGKKIFFEL